MCGPIHVYSNNYTDEDARILELPCHYYNNYCNTVVDEDDEDDEDFIRKEIR